METNTLENKRYMLVGIKRLNPDLSMIEMGFSHNKINDALLEFDWFSSCCESSAIVDNEKEEISKFNGDNIDVLKKSLCLRGIKIHT